MILSDAEIIRILAPDQATWLDVKDPAQFSDGVARRRWNIPVQAADEVAQWLRFHTDAGNVTTVTAGTPPVTTVTPVVTFKVTAPGARLSIGAIHLLAGDWRGGEVDIEYGGQNPQEQNKNIVVGLIQTLREGFVTSITQTVGEATVMDFSEVRLTNLRKRQWFDGKYDPMRSELAMVWPNIDASKLKACTDSVAATLTNPVINGETYTGTWYRKEYNSAREEDGTGMVAATYSTEPDDITIKVSAAATETAQRSITRTDNRAAANAVVAGAVVPTNGKSLSGSIQQTAEGSLAEITTETAVALTTAHTMATTSASETHASITDLNVLEAATPPTPPSTPAAVDGKVVIVRVEKSAKYPGIVTKTIEEEDAVMLDSDWVERADVYGTARRRRAVNCTADQVAAIKGTLRAPLTTTNGVSYPININFMATPSTKYPGRYEVDASEEPGKPITPANDPWRNYQISNTYYQELHNNGKHYKRLVTHAVKNCGDEATAAAFNAAGTGTNIQGTHVEDHGYSRFTAHRLQVDDTGDDMGWVEYTI